MGLAELKKMEEERKRMRIIKNRQKAKKLFQPKSRQNSYNPSSNKNFLEANELRVGDVVMLSRGIGIVRYVGALHCAEESENWIGIELKAPEGKNDGTVQGRSYFKCPQGHGVFVKRVKKKIQPDDLLE